MRLPFAALLLAGVATPALAAPRHADDAEVARTVERLNDPVFQSALSGAMLAMSDALMDVRIDRLRAAIARIDPDARRDWDDGDTRTLGDLMARDDPYFREKLAHGSRAAIGTMGTMATSMADMAPELRAMAERMGRDVERAMRRLPRD